MACTKIVISVIGKQEYEDNDDCIELTTIGTIEKSTDKYLIRYKESHEDEKDVMVTLKIKQDGSLIEMLRMNKSTSILTIEKSKRNLCSYNTPYGNIFLGIYGKEIKIDINDNKGSVDFTYDIDINGQVSSHNTVSVKFKPTQNQED